MSTWFDVRCLRSLAMATAVLLGGCQSMTQPGHAGVGGAQLVLLSRSVTDSDAIRRREAIVAPYRARGSLDADREQVERVQRIVDALLVGTAAFEPDAPTWAMRVHVIPSPLINAVSSPGEIVVDEGLLVVVEDDDDQLAFVLGHEIGHQLRRHYQSDRSYIALEAMLAPVLAFAGGPLGVIGGEALLDLGVRRPRQRVDELEADAIGIELAARAGYAPEGASRFLGALSDLASQAHLGGPLESILGGHPDFDVRLKRAQVLAGQARELYLQAKEK